MSCQSFRLQQQQQLGLVLVWCVPPKNIIICSSSNFVALNFEVNLFTTLFLNCILHFRFTKRNFRFNLEFLIELGSSTLFYLYHASLLKNRQIV